MAPSHLNVLEQVKLARSALNETISVTLLSNMYIPTLQERVEIAGRLGLFLVLAVNRETGSVDVLSLADSSYLIENVSFASLRPYRADVPLETK